MRNFTLKISKHYITVLPQSSLLQQARLFLYSKSLFGKMFIVAGKQAEWKFSRADFIQHRLLRGAARIQKLLVVPLNSGALTVQRRVFFGLWRREDYPCLSINTLRKRQWEYWICLGSILQTRRDLFLFTTLEELWRAEWWLWAHAEWEFMKRTLHWLKKYWVFLKHKQ